MEPLDVFNELPLPKRQYMVNLFKNCSNEVKEYMHTIEIDADKVLISAGEKCDHIYIILSGKVSGIEWPVLERPYAFKDFGPGDFFGEIEYFADLADYRISVITITKCHVLLIPVVYYMEWIQKDSGALYLRTKENMRRLITQTAEARKHLFLEGRDRLMLYLIGKYEQHQILHEILEMKQTRNQIAEEVGLTTKTLERSIKKLEQMGVIRLQKGKIIVTKEQCCQMKKLIEQRTAIGISSSSMVSRGRDGKE